MWTLRCDGVSVSVRLVNVHVDVWGCLGMFGDVWGCLGMFVMYLWMVIACSPL